MKHLKRFNEEIDDPQYMKCQKFHQTYKSLVDFDESEQGYEPTNMDLISDIGDLCNKLNMTKEDVKFVLDNFDCSFDTDKLLQSTYNEWVDEQSKYSISITIPHDAYLLLRENGVPESNIVAAYTHYANHALGITYGTDLDEFRVWCEKDNLADFQEEE